MGTTAPTTTLKNGTASDKVTDEKQKSGPKQDSLPPATPDPNRGQIGGIVVRPSKRDFTSSRTRATTNPVHLAVRDAKQGEAYDLLVDNDEGKIDRVKRMLRAAAQNYDVGMSIHPDTPKDEHDSSKVLVTFKTGPREKRAKPVGAEAITPKTDTESTPAKA